MLRVRKRLSHIAFFSAILLFAPAASLRVGAAEIPSYAAGTRIAIPAAPELRFRISADGPSVLWIRAESPHLLSLKVEHSEAAAWVQAANGWAECVLPIYEAGAVDITLTAVGMGGDIVVTTSYGIGTSWDAAAVSRALRSFPVVPSPIHPKETAQPASPESRAVEMKPSEPVILERPAAGEAPAATVTPVGSAASVLSAPPSAASAPATASASPSSSPSSPPASTTPSAFATPTAPATPTDREIPFLSNPVALFIGEPERGTFPESGELGLATYRVYIPNSLGFSVWVNGNVHVRVRAVDANFEVGDYSAAPQKIVRVPAPTDGWYLVALRGRGPYGITAVADE